MNNNYDYDLMDRLEEDQIADLEMKQDVIMNQNQQNAIIEIKIDEAESMMVCNNGMITKIGQRNMPFYGLNYVTTAN